MTKPRYTESDRQDAKSLAEQTVAMRKPQYGIDSKEIRRKNAEKTVKDAETKFNRQVKKGIRHPDKKESETAQQQRALADLMLEFRSESKPLSDTAKKNLDTIKKPTPAEKQHENQKDKPVKASETWPFKRKKK